MCLVSGLNIGEFARRLALGPLERFDDVLKADLLGVPIAEFQRPHFLQGRFNQLPVEVDEIGSQREQYGNKTHEH